MKGSGWAIPLGMALCALGLVACGGGGSGSDGGGESASREEAVLEFAECMRENGVDLADPQPGDESIEIGDPTDPATMRAREVCDEKLDEVAQEITPEEDEEFKEGWLAFSRCMRDQGIEMADPKFLGAGKVRLGISGIDTSSPAFEAAREACGDVAPEMSGPGVGG